MEKNIQYHLFINKNKQGLTNPKEVIQDVLTALPDLKFRSVPALKEIYTTLLEIAAATATFEKEKSKGGERASLTRYIKQIERWQNKVLPDEHLTLLSYLYDIILQLEGMGLLMGFGLYNYEKEEGKRKIRSNMNLLNPEKQSMYDFFTNKGGYKMAKKFEITYEDLVVAAKEFQELLGINPPIDTTGDEKYLKGILTEAIEKLITPDDKFSEETSKVIKALKEEGKGEAPPPVEKKPVKEKAKKATPETKPAVEKKEPEKKETKPPATEKTKEPPKEAQPKKDVRGKVMADILVESADKPMTKKEMVEKMLKRYGGTEVDAYFYVSYSIRLAKELGLIKKGEDDTLSYKA